MKKRANQNGGKDVWHLREQSEDIPVPEDPCWSNPWACTPSWNFNGSSMEFVSLQRLMSPSKRSMWALEHLESQHGYPEQFWGQGWVTGTGPILLQWIWGLLTSVTLLIWGTAHQYEKGVQNLSHMSNEISNCWLTLDSPRMLQRHLTSGASVHYEWHSIVNE